MELRLARGAYVYLPPNIAGYVGGDHVSMLLSAVDEGLLIGDDGPTVVALDIGTNTDISLFHGGRLFSCSCASGPAFEGAHIADADLAAPIHKGLATKELLPGEHLLDAGYVDADLLESSREE